MHHSACLAAEDVSAAGTEVAPGRAAMWERVLTGTVGFQFCEGGDFMSATLQL